MNFICFAQDFLRAGLEMAKCFDVNIQLYILHSKLFTFCKKIESVKCKVFANFKLESTFPNRL
jgi:hypothetical protein